MDYFGSLDLQSPPMAERVRSWYMLEHYRNLERNQLDAAQKLRNRCCQEQIVLRELTARKERRRGLDLACRSESKLDAVMPERRCDCAAARGGELDDSAEDYSVDDSKYAGRFDDSAALSDDTDSERALEPTAQTIDVAQDIDAQMGVLEESFRAIRECVKAEDVSECETTAGEARAWSRGAGERARGAGARSEIADGARAFWAQLVNFARHFTRLNHGNCYCDYGTQFSTAVLAFDFFRLSVTNLCDILQPYVCPISYDTDDDYDEGRAVKREHPPPVTKLKKEYCEPSTSRRPACQGTRDCEARCGCVAPYSSDKIANPMLEVVRYIDILLQNKTQ